MLKTSVYLIFILSCLFFCDLSANIDVYNSLCNPEQNINRIALFQPRKFKTRVHRNTIVTNLAALEQTIFRGGKLISFARGSVVPGVTSFEYRYYKCKRKTYCYTFIHTSLVQNPRRDVEIVINQDVGGYNLATYCIIFRERK